MRDGCRGRACGERGRGRGDRYELSVPLDGGGDDGDDDGGTATAIDVRSHFDLDCVHEATLIAFEKSEYHVGGDDRSS